MFCPDNSLIADLKVRRLKLGFENINSVVDKKRALYSLAEKTGLDSYLKMMNLCTMYPFCACILCFAALVECDRFPRPSFVSEWLVVSRDCAGHSSHQIAHGLGVVPLLVEVLVKPIDGPNKDFQFRASGHQIGDAAGHGEHAGVIYLYNEEFVLVSGPTSNDGYCIMIDEDYWTGPPNTAQKSTTCLFQVRAWTAARIQERGYAMYNSPPTIIRANDSSATKFEFEAPWGLSLVIVRIKFPGTVNYPGYYADSMGATHATYNRFDGGYVVYYYYDRKIRVEASPNQPYLYKGGHGFAFNVQVSEASLEIVGFSTTDMGTTFQWRANVTEPEFQNILQTQPGTTNESFSQAYYEYNGWRGLSTGTCVTYDTRNTSTFNFSDPAQCTYGGMIFAQSIIHGQYRIWVPTYKVGGYGAVYCVSGLHTPYNIHQGYYHVGGWLISEPCELCQNGATCQYDNGLLSCKCTSNWTGQYCTEDVDECESITCEYERLCHNTVGSYYCDCGRTGDTVSGDVCQVVLDASEINYKEIVPGSVLTNSVSQLELGSNVNILYIPGASGFDDLAYSIISNRYECSKVTLSMNTADNDPTSLTLILTIVKEPSLVCDLFTCTIEWGDESDEQVTLDEVRKQINHTYGAYGIYPISLTCEGKESPSCPERYPGCVSSTNFLDSNHKSLETPLVFLTTEQVVIESIIDYSSEDCGIQEYYWRIVGINNLYIKAFSEFEQPMRAVLTVDANTLPAGEYVVILQLRFNGNVSYWYEDSIILKMVLPELVTLVPGHYEEVERRASSYVLHMFPSDPVGHQPWVAIHESSITWTFAHIKEVLDIENIPKYMANFPNSVQLSSLEYYKIEQKGRNMIFVINLMYFPNNTYYIATGQATRGSRSTISYKIIRVLDNIKNIRLRCIYNCINDRYMTFTNDRVQLHVWSEYGPNRTYVWEVYKWNQQIEMFENVTGSVVLEIYDTGGTYCNMNIPAGQLEQGQTYKIRVTASQSASTSSAAEIVGTVNFAPYNGTCTVPKKNVIAAMELVRIDCSDWLGTNGRNTKNSSRDVNPFLRFSIFQRTAGALIDNELVSVSPLKTLWVVLKAGDHFSGFPTSVDILVTDIFGDYTLSTVSLVSQPPIDTLNIGTDIEDSYIISNFAVKVTDHLTYLDTYVSLEAAVFFVSAAASIIHSVQIKEWVPPIPIVPDINSYILDLNVNGGPNINITSFDDLLNSASDFDVVDYTSLAIRELYGVMLLYLQTVFENTITNSSSSRYSDTKFKSLCTNAVSNLGNSYYFLTNETTEIYVNLSAIVGQSALEIENIETASESQVERTSEEINNLINSMVMSTIPDSAKHVRIIDTVAEARHEIANLLILVGEGVDIEGASISPLERAYIYMYQQQLLKRQLEEAKEAAHNVSLQSTEYANIVLESWMNCSKCGNKTGASFGATQHVQRNPADTLAKNVTTTSMGSFQLTSIESDVGSSTEPVTVSALEFKKNIYMYDDDGTSAFVSSNVLRIDAKSQNNPITSRQMMFEQHVTPPSPVRVTPIVDAEDASEFMYHQFIYRKITDSVCLKIIPVEDSGTSSITSYKVYLNFKSSPTVLEYDILISVNGDEDWQRCIQPTQMSGHTGVVYLGIHLPIAMRTDYYFTVFTMGCLTWEEASRKWHADKCELEWIASTGKIKCQCHDLTDMVFGNSFVVAPNSIDFSAVFLKFSPLNQAAVIGTLGGLFLLYFISVILLRKKDRWDALKWGITPLRDNIITDENYYILKIYTGMRPGAGTKSRVAFVLSGEEEDTGPRELFDGVRQEFSTGSTMSFFMTTKYHLGELHHLHIWHDNNGGGDLASWYLNQVVVYDVLEKRTFTFECERWLSVETSVNALLSSTPPNNPVQFETRFFYQTKNRLSEGHMWASIMFRPELSTFTRVQRVSCAMLYMFLNMIASAMFFNPDPNYEIPPLFELGPFTFTPQQIFVSIVCALVTTPPTMLLIFLFKRTKRQIRPLKLVHKPSKKGQWSCCCYCRVVCFCHCRRKKKYIKSKDEYTKRLESKILSPEEPDFSGGFYLPHWFVYVAWGFYIAGVVTCGFFIMMYSMEWGKQKSEKWLTTLFLSILESILFVDPIMVICTAFVLAFLVRSNKEDSNTDMNVVIQNYKKLVGLDKVTLASGLHILKSVSVDYKEHMSLPRNVSVPLDGAKLQHAAEEHKHKARLKSMAWDLLYNVFFILIVASICFANRSTNSYLHYSEIFNSFVEPAEMPKFSQITTPGDFFEWVNVTVLPTLMPLYDITGQKLHWTQKLYVDGSSSMILGPPRLRQLRMDKGFCTIPHIGQVECIDSYKIRSEQTQNFCSGWLPGPCNTTGAIQKSANAWKFTSALDIWGLPVPGSYATYGGGGYIAEFDVNYEISLEVMNELFHNLWIDRQTTAVFMEFTFYNGFTNIFTHSNFMVEFPESGGAFLSYQTYPLRLYQHLGPIGTYTLACEAIFVVYLIILLVRICVRIYQQGRQYFKEFWRVYDIVILALGLVACVVYAFRLGFTTITIEKYKEDMNAYVNFAHIVFWDQILVTLLGCLAFMATMHLLEAFGMSNRVKALVEVFARCGKDLFWYGMMFVHMLFGFCFLGVLLFGSKLESYMNIYECLGTLFISMIGKSKFAEIDETDPILAKLYFILYITVTVFFVMTMFLSILCGTIDEVVQEIRSDTRPDLIDMMLKELKDLIPGSKKSHVTQNVAK